MQFQSERTRERSEHKLKPKHLCVVCILLCLYFKCFTLLNNCSNYQMLCTDQRKVKKWKQMVSKLKLKNAQPSPNPRLEFTVYKIGWMINWIVFFITILASNNYENKVIKIKWLLCSIPLRNNSLILYSSAPFSFTQVQFLCSLKAKLTFSLPQLASKAY